MPIGTLYDPFVTRGLDALYHALYSGARFIVAATPSGVSLSPEGGAHQSVITPGIGIALPAIATSSRRSRVEVEWILLDALARLGRGEAARAPYLRLSTRPVDQALAPAPSPALRAAVLRGGLPPDRRARGGRLGPRRTTPCTSSPPASWCPRRSRRRARCARRASSPVSSW